MPITMPVSVVVTRTQLAFPDLELESAPDGRRVVSVGPGELQHRITWATSHHVPGAYPTNIVRDMQRALVTVRVNAINHATLESRVAEVIEAFGQFEYTISVDLGSGGPDVWRCHAFEQLTIGEGATINGGLHRLKYMEITATIPRHPYPSSGQF